MSIEKKKLQLELLRVQAGKAEVELKVYEHMENIRRLEVALKIQSEKEIELKNRLESLQGE